MMADWKALLMAESMVEKRVGTKVETKEKLRVDKKVVRWVELMVAKTVETKGEW